MTIVSNNTSVGFNQIIKKRTITTSKYYDEEGRLSSEDVVEEIEYETVRAAPVQPYYDHIGPGWWQNPVVSGGSVHKITDPYEEAPPVKGLIN